MLALPYSIEDVGEDEKEERRRLYPDDVTIMVGVVRVKGVGVLLPNRYRSIAEEVYNFQVRPDDVFLVSFGKAGSTVSQEMVWQILHGFDLEGGKESILSRAPFLEMTSIVSRKKASTFNNSDSVHSFLTDSVGFTASRPSPRVIKTHLPLELLPPALLDTCRVIAVCRNPKDSIVSLFHHERLIPEHGFAGEFDEFARMFMRGDVIYGDYWTHLKSNWSRRNHPNMLLLWYEDLRRDLRSTIARTASFLKADLPASKVDLLTDHLHIDNFRKNDAVNMKPAKGSVPDDVRERFNFVRKGEVGNWREYFKGDLLRECDEWVGRNNKDADIPFKFDR